MAEDNQGKNLKALGVTIGVHALLLVGLLFAGFSAPPPLPDQDLGMEVNLGTSDEGMGDVQPLNPNPPADAADVPVPQNLPTPPQENAAPPQDIATQDQEDAPEVKQPEKPVEKPVEKPEKLDANTPKTNNKPKAEAPPAPPAPPKPKPKAEFPPTPGAPVGANGGNNANGSNNSTGEGNTGKPGDRGQINGDPNASGYTGSGGLGGGRSDFRLNGRSLISKPKPTYEGNESGYIAINIKVDKQGNVTDATHSLRGSTLNNPRLIDIARRAAREIKYNASPDAPEVQFGTIRFYFKVQ